MTQPKRASSLCYRICYSAPPVADRTTGIQKFYGWAAFGTMGSRATARR